MQLRISVAAIVLTFGAAPLWGQVAAGRVLSLGRPVAADAAAVAVEAAGAKPRPTESSGSGSSDEQKQKDEARKQQRLQKIQQLQFDRRPSATLKAWVEVHAPKEPDKSKPVAAPRPRRPIEARRRVPAIAMWPADSPKAKAAAEAKAAAAEKVFDQKLKDFQQNVTLGRWPEVKLLLAGMSKEESKAAYDRLLDALRSGPTGAAMAIDPNMLSQMILDGADTATMQAVLAASGQGPGGAFAEQNFFAIGDVVGIIAAAPYELEDESFIKLGTIVRQILRGGMDVELLIGELAPAAGSAPANSRSLLNHRQLAKLLFAAGQDLRAGAFLPELAQAEADTDDEALNLLSRYYLAQHAKEKSTAILEQAWAATQAVLASATLAAAPAPEAAAGAASGQNDEQAKARQRAQKQKEEALKRAVELAPRLRDELGQQWLDESFTTRSQRGREILAAIGTQVAMNLPSRPYDPDFRLGALKLQQTAVEALVAASPQTAQEWTETLSMLVGNWLREAEVSQNFDQRDFYGQNWRRDRYGNYFFIDDEEAAGSVYRYQQNQVRAIPSNDLLEARPSEKWLALIDAGLKPKVAATYSKLFLKVNEEDEAFPFIEQLAQTHPDQARDLAHEFLRVWTKNHNPNENRDEYRPYIYYWGYESRAERIPLTRSKQVRNLEELAGWVARLRALPIGELDEQLLAGAFTTSHSRAEVYQLESLERVFGSVDTLEPKTLAELIQQMRGNLASLWRAPDVQAQNSTNRKQKDIQAEVLQGYEIAKAVARRGLEKHSNHWALQLVEAAILYDENDYDQELEKTSEYSARRKEAMSRFQRAAQSYAQAVPGLKEDEESTLVYEQWFYAGLGAVDLPRVTDDKVPDPQQPALIREALLALPPEAAERHMDKFANNLFSRLRTAKPELKFRYLRSGFEIVGDNKLAREARKVLDYYADLVTEIKLDTQIDGSDVVGHTQPFGVFVNLKHTKEIERESGGFGRYLQNQNNSNYYYYNFGRPTENYRDKFTETVTQAYEEHFEVLSVTFQNAEVNSIALPEYGWRVTPYAYLLLKAKGPEVDKLPPVHLNLDFLDTSGYAIIPVESPALPIDARPQTAPARPASDISVVQTLDERQADEGKLILEIKATAHGLVPELGELVTLDPADFEVVSTEDEGVSVSEFDKEAEGSQITSERLWTVTLQARQGLPEKPKEFRFAAAKAPLKEILYQRYNDADLVEATELISLEESYGNPRRTVLWASLGIVAVVLAGVFAVRRMVRNRRPAPQARFQLPETINPFTVLGLLRDIQHNDGLGAAGKQELAQSISRLERHYFEETAPAELDLREIAHKWVSRAR